jgi:hypothetical protein
VYLFLTRLISVPEIKELNKLKKIILELVYFILKSINNIKFNIRFTLFHILN